MSDSFEDQYLDVLQNLESALAQVYREHDEMTDYDAQRALEALIRWYSAESSGRTAPEPHLKGLSKTAYDSVFMICEWRLGRSQPFQDKKGRTREIEVEPLAVTEIVACLKRVKRSVDKWNKRGGRRGYFDFVDEFLP